MSRVQRPQKMQLRASRYHHWIHDPDEAEAYMDQCEADIAELVEALQQSDIDFRVAATWAPDSRRIRPKERADAIQALIAKHTEDTHE